MADLTLRLEKGSELTFREIDDNFLNLDSEIHYVMSQLDSGLDLINLRLDSEHSWNVSDHNQLQANIDSVNARVTARDSAVVNKIILDLVDSSYVTSKVDFEGSLDSAFITARVDFEGNVDSAYVKERVKTDQDLLTTSDVTFEHIQMTHASGALSFEARNNSGSQISKGSVVYISADGATPEVSLAANTSSSTMPACGIVLADIADGSSGYVVSMGPVLNINTSSFSIGDTLYVGAVGGTLTNVKPSGSALVQNIATVHKVDASTGTIKVGGADRANDTPNLLSGQIFYGNVSNYAVATNLTSVVDSSYLSDFITNGYLNSIGVGQTLASTDELAEGTSNLYYTEARFNSVFSKRNTDSLSEGSTNLYYTNTRVDNHLATLSTDNLSEGATNLYYTDTRARNAVSAGNGISYVAGTGVFTVAGNTNLTQDADGLSLSTAPTGLTNVGTDKVTLGSWTIELSGNNLVFKFGGATKMSLSNTGKLTATGDLEAFGTP